MVTAFAILAMFCVSPVVVIFQSIRLVFREASLLHHRRKGCGRPGISAQHLLSYQLNRSLFPHLQMLVAPFSIQVKENIYTEKRRCAELLSFAMRVFRAKKLM